MTKFSDDSLKKWIASLPLNSFASTNESNIKFEEAKSKITFVNKSRKDCLKVDVDGGVVSSSETVLRCDKLLVEKSVPQFCFVELKGSDIKHAVEQLEASLKDIRLNPACLQQKLAFVVGRNHYPSSSPLIQNAMKKFRALNVKLVIANTPAIYAL